MAPPVSIKREDTILTITFERDLTDDEHSAHLAQLSEIIAQGKVGQVHKWVVLNEMRVFIQANAMHRRRQADWMHQHEEELRHRTAGVGFVLTSGLMRGGLTAVLWLAPLPCPHGVFSTLKEAQAWAEGRCRMPVDPRARAPRAQAS